MALRTALLRFNRVSRVASHARALTPHATRSVAVAQSAPLAFARAFNTSIRACGQGESDSDLISSLEQEILYEKEATQTDETDGNASSSHAWLDDFKKDGIWSIEDKSGSDEIALTRDFGNEHIRVLFSIGEIDTTDPANEIEQEDADLSASGEQEYDATFPVRCAISITKRGHGSLNIDAQAQDSQFMIENVTFYKDDVLATELTAEADWKRRGLYMGPQFETLDENVQAQFESYLAERGISTKLAMFIPNFAENKEQREYCSWLEHVKTFVAA
ncbi:Mitochondrial acidic protein mam33 [Malassezia vespertilionis]|uniref:Mam33p n=1 Tax=Malassezia vespertilionis TaxID=2020962 RepID=A0A2N1JFX0_9BASI|nr:Mitochondrial acidic protein mam33 [Malassezia vespertilionis]PKI85450.1 Mam33p [Malassezia vespertilionis]WFD05308.1 Mitochondrial acidic protein mam33 [Malassezia vespertilionis]